ncbi:MAG: sigma-70 family RNA polymerase sigma factor [Clostridiales bacterium]|nr:sigma-70 family RNA polymerase sigma factor [Clostridiales bacterium]
MIDYKSPNGAEHFVNTYADMILRICLTYSLNKADAQDICQEIYIKLFKGGYRFGSHAQEKAFIAKAAANACKDMLRSCWFKERRNTDFILDKAEEKSGEPELKSVLEHIPAKYREAVYFYCYEGYDINETAEIIGRSADCVKKRLSRAREMLRKELETII